MQRGGSHVNIRISAMVLLILSAASPLQAASIKLTWGLSVSATGLNPGTVNVYRITARCPATTSVAKWLKLAVNVPAWGPYIDRAASTHYPHCYYVTAVIDGVESPPSNMIFVPAAPVSLQGVWQP